MECSRWRWDDGGCVAFQQQFSGLALEILAFSDGVKGIQHIMEWKYLVLSIQLRRHPIRYDASSSVSFFNRDPKSKDLWEYAWSSTIAVNSLQS
jgi:hypothetical protein